VQQWFFSAYVHRVGHYLIELHSGRLRVGAKRYRELMAQHAPLPGPPNESRSPSADVGEDRVEPTPARSSESVTLTLIGQVKAGKSSLVNALLGERRAATDVLPLTDAITRYHLAPLPGVGTSLAILDTVGYGREGPRADQLPATEKAASESDALLLVLHATNPGRQADLALLERLETWFAAHPEYKKPPIVGVLTHVDLLTPAMEWSPPYDWAAGQRRKEQAMRDAITAVTEHFGSRLAGIVPVCVADGKVWNVRDGLLGVLAARMDEAGAVGLVRALHAEANEGRVRKLWSQLVAGGRAALGVLAERVVR
jgi:predicted GTPase